MNCLGTQNAFDLGTKRIMEKSVLVTVLQINDRIVLVIKARPLAARIPARSYAQRTLKSDGNVLAGDSGDVTLCLPDCLLAIVLTLFTPTFCSQLLFFKSFISN